MAAAPPAAPDPYYFIKDLNKFYGISHGCIQCCGSGSTCFWVSRIRLSLSKSSKKNLDFYCFVTYF
jgi:hypothetical protein